MERRQFRGRSKLAVSLAFGFVLPLFAAACQTDQPGVEVRTQTVDREVQKPCPGIVPQRPAKLEPLPDNPVSALALVLAKLAAYSAPGEYADQAEAYVKACPPSG